MDVDLIFSRPKVVAGWVYPACVNGLRKLDGICESDRLQEPGHVSVLKSCQRKRDRHDRFDRKNQGSDRG